MAASETSKTATDMALVVVDLQNPPSLAQSPANPAAQIYSAGNAAGYKLLSASSSSHQPVGVVSSDGVNADDLNQSSATPLKRTRGRPRKYGPDGATAIAQMRAAAMLQPSVRAYRAGRRTSSSSAAAPSGPSAAATISPSPPMPSSKGKESNSIAPTVALDKTVTGLELVVANMQNPPSPANPAAQSYSTDKAPGYKHFSASSSSYKRAGIISSEGAIGEGNSGYLNMSSGTPLKHTKGRPRKYGPDGALSMAQMRAAAMPKPSVRAARARKAVSSSVATSSPLSVAATISPSPAMPSSRCRATNSSAYTVASGVYHSPIMISNIVAEKGEDVSAKIIAFSQNSVGAISVISATGSLSVVTLRHPAMSDETAIYEGQYAIQNMFGSFVPSKVGDLRRKTGGLSIVLLGANGRTLYGHVAGLLVASSPVQVTVRSFAPDDGPELGFNATASARGSTLRPFIDLI